MVQITKTVHPPKALTGSMKEKTQLKFMTSSVNNKGGGASAGKSYLGENPFVALPMESFDQRRIRNKAATAQLMDWFLGEWATWQRQGLLCGLAKRSSPSQTKYLLSALEPVFHQDFLLQAGGVYPWQWIGKGKPPIKLQKVDKKRYKRTRLLRLAKQRLKEKPSHLQNIISQLDSLASPSPAADDDEGKVAQTTEKPTLKKQDSVSQLRTPGDKSKGGVPNESTRKASTESPRSTPNTGRGEGTARTPKGRFEVGRHKWLKLKTVQMLDPSTILGDQDRGLEMREQLVDGLGNWDATQLRRSLPLPFASSFSPSGGSHPQHFMLKSAALAQTRTSRRIDFQRDYTKSSMSFRTENMYTPGGGFERGLPKNKEEMKRAKEQYKKQLRVIYQWMGSMTESEMGEALGSILISTSNSDLRFLTSCLIKRDNESFDINHLTDSLLLNVFQYLKPRDLHHSAQVCSRWFYLCSLQPLWQRHCLNLGKKFLIDSLEELVDVFQLDNNSSYDTHPSIPEGGSSLPKMSLSVPRAGITPAAPPPLPSSIDWKYAYGELYDVISEAVKQIEAESNLLLLTDGTKKTNQPITKDHDSRANKVHKEQPKGDTVKKRGLGLPLTDPSKEDKWLKREVEYLYGDLIHSQPHTSKEPKLDPGLYYSHRDIDDDVNTTLSDLYDIHSLMCRKERWKINLDWKESREGGRPRSSSVSMGSETVVQELALQMGGVRRARKHSYGSNEGAQSTGESDEEESFRLRVAGDAVSSSGGSREGEGSSGVGKDEDQKLAAVLKRHSLYSFERLEIKQYQEWKSREAFLQLKQRRLDGKKISKAAHDNEVEENRKENKKEIAVDSCLIDGDVRREEAPSRMTGQLEGDPKEVNFADDGSLRLENEHLDNEMLKIEKSKQPKFSQSEDAKKKHEVVEHIEVETIHETAVPVIPVATATTQKPPGAAEGGGEEETRKKLLLQMQLGERDESGYPIIQMDRAMIGQIALDIRPPAVQPPDLLPEMNRCTYDVEWKYPKKPSNRRKGAKYQNRILALKQLKILHGHMDAVLCMKLAWGRLMTGSIDQSLRVWCAGSGRSMHKLFGHRGSVSALDFNEDWIVTGSWDMSIIVWNSSNYKYVTTLFGHQAKVSCLALREHFLFSGSHDCSIRLWDVENDFVCLKQYLCPSGVTSLTLLPLLPKNSRKIIHPETENRNMPHECIFTSFDGVIRILDLKHDKCMDLEGHSREVSCLRVTGDLIISGSFDGQVRFWNKRSLECESAIRAHSQAVLCLEFHRRKFYTGSQDSTIREWDLHTMTCMRILHGHKGPVRGLKVSDRRIISCSDDSEVRFWELYDPLEER